MLLNSLQCTGQPPLPPKQRIILPLDVNGIKVQEHCCNVLNNEQEQVDPGLMYLGSAQELFRAKMG